jgi:hypothetical protein
MYRPRAKDIILKEKEWKDERHEDNFLTITIIIAVK